MHLIKSIYPGFCLLSMLLLTACEKSPVTPARIDIEAAARTWNTPQKTWNESDLYMLERGRHYFQSNCAACHQSSGEGQQTIGAPALKGSAIAKGPADELITLVLDGRNTMPSFRDSVDAARLAAILSYIRNAWGNEADVIGVDTVAALLQPDSSQEAEH